MRQMSDPTVDWGKWAGGALAGALLMYMLDPDRGAPRRAQSGEKIRGLTRQTGNALGTAVRGIGSTVGSRVEGIAGKLGAVADTVTASLPDGAARPNGALGKDAGEAAGVAGKNLVQGVSKTAGELMHSASQGAGQMVHGAQQMVRTAVQGDWAPGMRSAAVLGGGALGMAGLVRRSPLGIVLGLAGLVLLARGATNLPLRSMIKSQPLAQPIDLEKTIRIDASPEQVYDLWTNYENFPHFMSHVVEVRDLGGRRSHWVVRGPAGTEFEWDAVTTEQSRPRRLAWRSEPGAEIAQSGSVEFEPFRGGTLVTVRMSYTPPAGVLGHGLATLLGADPKSQMDDDLARMKAFIERGVMPHEASRRPGMFSKFLH